MCWKNKKQTDRTKFKVAINNRLAVQIEKVENKAEYLGQSPAMDEKETFDATQISLDTYDTDVWIKEVFAITNRIEEPFAI